MPAVAHTDNLSDAALRTSRTSRASSQTAGRAASRTASGRGAARSTPAAQRAAAKKKDDAVRARNAEVVARNAALKAAEAAEGGDPDDSALESGYVGPAASVEEVDDDAAADALPPSDFEEDNELPVASSDPIEFEDSDDVIVSSSVDPFVTPVKRSKRGRADVEDSDEGEAPAKSAKITKKDITPRSVRFGVEVKKHLVLVTAMKNPYPGTLNRVPHIAGIMEDVASAHAEDTDYMDTLRRLKKMPEKFHKLLVWVMYARGGFINQLARVCREQLGSLGLPGSMAPTEIVEVVTWLLKHEAWKFGSLNITKREFNRSAPFGAPFFEAVPRALFMDGRGKANSETFRFLIEMQQVPLVFMALTMTAIEHCINEWRDGTQRRADFKEDASVRYLYHLAGLEHVDSKAPMYMAKLQSDIFESMLVHTNKTFLLESSVSDAMGSLDFSALEQSASG